MAVQWAANRCACLRNLIYLIVGALIFVLSDEVFYAQIDCEKYRNIFSVFLALSGLVLILKSLG